MMGPYCKYCNHRCFQPNNKGDLQATCKQGKEASVKQPESFDRSNIEDKLNDLINAIRDEFEAFDVFEHLDDQLAYELDDIAQATWSVIHYGKKIAKAEGKE